MTAEGRQRYDLAGRSAYGYGYDGNAAREPQRWEEAPVRRNRTQRNKSAPRHLDLQVRESGKIAPFAVLGLAAVCLLVILTLSQYAKLVEVNDAAVDLSKQIATMKQEESKLLAQYELAYDLQAIENELLASGEMVKPQSGQSYVIALTRPDSAQYYERASFGSGILSGIEEIFSAIGTYF